MIEVVIADAGPLVAFRRVPMSLADACLVRLSEKHETCRVFTVDSDFTLYRRHGRKTIPLLAPFVAAS